MEESPNELKNPNTEYFLGELDSVLNKRPSKESLNVLNEQKPPQLLEQDLLPPVTDGVDLDLDVQEKATLDSLQKNTGVSQIPPQRPSRPQVHMFSYVVNSPPGHSREISREPKFKSVEEAILHIADGRTEDQIISIIIDLREKGDIKHDTRITKALVGRTISDLIQGRVLVLGEDGGLKVVRVGGGSVPKTENTQPTEVTQGSKPSVFDKMNSFVDAVTDRALEGTAYGRLVDKLQSLIDTAPQHIKSKLKTFLHFKVDGKKIEDVLNNLSAIQGLVSGDEYSQLIQVAQSELKAQESREKEIEKTYTFDTGISTVASDRHPQHNEDKFLQEKESKVFAVFDGMGGVEGGERASTLALQYVKEEISHIAKDASVEEVTQSLQSILENANKVVFRDPFQSGKDVSERMGTTATLVKVIEDTQGEKIVVASVGDSRVYIHHVNGSLEQVTIDANRAHFEMRAEGKTEDEIRVFQKKTNNATSLSAFDNTNPAQRMAEMMRYNQRNEISSALGILEETEVNTYERDVENGDIILVTSDGVHDNLTDDEIENYIRESITQGLTAHEISSLLIEKALQRSREKDPNNSQQKHFRAKSDDITALVVCVGNVDQTLELDAAPVLTTQDTQIEPSPLFIPKVSGTESKESQIDVNALVNQAENIDQLCGAVETICQTEGDIRDGEKVFTAEQIVTVIKKGGQFSALDLPLTYGIRAKYRELVRPEKEDIPAEEKEKEIEPPPVYIPEVQTTPDLYDEPIGPVRKEDLSKEESEKIEREMRERLDDTREKFAAQESAYKAKVREGKKLFRSIMEKLGAPGKQRPSLEREVEHIEAEKAYMEAKWNLKNFISGRNIKEVPFSRADSLLGLSRVENKKIDVGVFEQAEKEYKLLQDRLREMTPEKEQSTIEKCFQKWNSLPLAQRVVLSSALLTAGGIALGTVGVSGALAAMGWRAGRAFVGTSLGLEVGRRYGNAKAEEIKEKRADRLNEYGAKNIRDKDQFVEEEKELEQFFEEEKSEIRKNQIKKGLVTAAVAGVSTVGIGMGGQAVIGESVPSGAKVSGNIDSTPKPKVAEVNKVSTKSWFDKFFKDNEGSVAKPSGAGLEASPQKVEVPSEVKGYKSVGVELSSKGFIDTVAQLKENLKGHSMSPAVEKLLSQSPEKIAMDLGLYKPGQVAESAFGLKGEQLTMNINGDITFMHNDGSTNILFEASGKTHQFGEYTGNTMFDADKLTTSPVPAYTVAQGQLPSEVAQTTEQPVAAETPTTPTENLGVTSKESVDLDGLTGALSSPILVAEKPGAINFNQIVAHRAEYTSPRDMITGKLPLKPEYQFDPKFKPYRTAYNLELEKKLIDIPQDMFDLRYPIEYNGGRINVFQKGDNITILLNGQQIGTGKIIDGQIGLQYEASLGKGILGVKSDFEQAFEEARERIEKNKMFFKVKQ